MNASHAGKLQSIIQHAYQHAPAVRRIMDEAGVRPDEINTVADLARIPVTGKDALVEMQRRDPPYGGFLAAPPDRLTHIFLSPGPLYEPSTGETAVMDTIRETLTVAGFKAGDIVLNAFGYHLIPSGLALDRVLAESGATVIPAGVGNADLQVKMMLDLGVTGYVGAPSWLMALIRKADELGLNFPEQFALRKALVSAEPLPPSLRQTFVEQYGLTVTNAYGTAELGFLAYNTEGGLSMRLLESSIVEVVHPETGQPVPPGEVGEVVVTTFNETYPLIRLGTGDLAVNVDPAPGHSRQGERSIVLVGRVGEAVKVRGMFVHPNQLRFAVGQLPAIARAQAVVTRQADRDELTLHVALADPALGAIEREQVAAALGTAVQSTCRVKIDRVEFVSHDALGEDTKPLVDARTWA